MPTPPQTTERAVVRLLLMDHLRQQVALCKQPEDPYWLLPCGLLPTHRTPHEYLATLTQRHLPETARAAVQNQLDSITPVAWIYPSAEVLPDATDVLQVVYLLTLSPELLEGRAARALHEETFRFWPVTDLPAELSPLDERSSSNGPFRGVQTRPAHRHARNAASASTHLPTRSKASPSSMRSRFSSSAVEKRPRASRITSGALER